MRKRRCCLTGNPHAAQRLAKASLESPDLKEWVVLKFKGLFLQQLESPDLKEWV